jgi:non-canonical purine NTP pyrophosphatase (RdgB/HAM1 family)
MNVTFITGNPNKAKVFAEYMGLDIAHKPIDLDEIQSLNLKDITEHKLRQAYEIVKAPVLVEDSGCSLEAFGKFPGPFVKWMLEAVGLEGICRSIDGRDRGSTADICFGFFDGKEMKFFEGSVHGTVPEHPRGESAFGWNAVFIPDGDDQTYAESGRNFREQTVFPELKKFLTNLDKQKT